MTTAITFFWLMLVHYLLTEKISYSWCSLVLESKVLYWPGMVTKFADYCQKREWCSLAKAGRTIYPTMGSLKARPLQINSVACISHLLQVKTGAR